MSDDGKKTNLSDKDLLSHLPDALVIVGNDNIVLRTEGAFETIFEKDENFVLGKDLTSINHDKRLRDIVERVRNSGSAISMRDVKLEGMPALFQKLDVFAHLINAEDILLTFSNRNLPGLMEQSSGLQRATMTAKGLAAMLAHEIKNPLSGIKGAAQLVARKLDTSQQRLTDVICKEVDRIRILVDELETFTNPEHIELESVNVHEALNHAIEVAMAGFANQAEIYPQFDPSLPEIAGHFDQLVQLFLNLIKNAVESSGPECRLKIHTSYRHGLWLTHDDNSKSRLAIEVSIHDDGPGISSEIIQHLFDPFVTNKEGGSGLGLSIVAQSMKNMGGFIEGENGKTEGAIFHMHFQSFKDYNNKRILNDKDAKY